MRFFRNILILSMLGVVAGLVGAKDRLLSEVGPIIAHADTPTTGGNDPVGGCEGSCGGGTGCGNSCDGCF